jgi:Flp pilus assembly pilin Flp
MKDSIVVRKIKKCFCSFVSEIKQDVRFIKISFSTLKNTKGQGTTEYAILVGVLAVIAIVAIGAFKGKVQMLWDAIKNGINGLS